MLDFLKNVSPTEIVIVGLIMVMLFGSKVVVSIAKSAGETMRELKGLKKTVGETMEETNKAFKNEGEVAK